MERPTKSEGFGRQTTFVEGERIGKTRRCILRDQLAGHRSPDWIPSTSESEPRPTKHGQQRPGTFDCLEPGPLGSQSLNLRLQDLTHVPPKVADQSLEGFSNIWTLSE